MSNDKTQRAYTQLTAKIDNVKVYAAGATITRVAQLERRAGETPQQVEIAGLPLALDDSSVRVQVESDFGTSTAIATDIRIGLAVPPRQETLKPPAEEEVREAKAEVQQIEDAIALIDIDNEIAVLHQLKVPKRPDGEEGKAPPPSPIGARLALANFSDEQIRARIQERRENVEKLRKAQEHLEDLQQKLAYASNTREARPNELRKTVVVRLSYEGEPETVTGQRLMVEYFVPGARWTPTYVCHLDSAGNQAAIAVRALLCQRTGEDWSGVRLELSTAEPMTWCELPELPSLRLGRAQSVMRKSGWRRPPIGAEILFEDFDRQKESAIDAMPEPFDFDITDISSMSVPPLPPLVLEYEPARKVEAEQSRARKRRDTNVFRIAQLRNPLQAPLLAGPADVYVDGEYILSTNIATVPPKGQMELGLGVEQAIKVARNTTYQEVRSGETLVAFNELRHHIQIDIANRLPREARIEVRERLSIPGEDAKVDVQIGQVSPEWEKYEQEERGTPIKGGYRWRVQVPAREEKSLSVDYTIKTFVDSELIGGNRRE